ncbi:hypothetical protein NBRC116495_22790 [Aurantivibrio plasticivorans]
MFFPMLAIKGADNKFVGPGVQTIDVYVNAVGVGSGSVKRLDATVFTKGMLSDASIE